MLKITLNDLLEISKKIDIQKSNLKVETPVGAKRIKAVEITAKDSQMVEIKTSTDKKLICSPNHRVKSPYDEWIFVKDLKIGDLVMTKSGIEPISDINELEGTLDLLDLEVEGSEYYTNSILSHNSSLIESFEFSLYGKVKSNKSRKWSKLSTLPNRINGELLNSIKFTSNGTEIEVKRGISPNKLELWENGVLNERAGKVNIDSSIEKYVGMDIETFKSFISLSINDFKNFISLTNEEKQILLDKLFNLEVINILNSILKDMNKANKTKMASLDAEINTLVDSINSIKESIKKAIEKEKENIQSEIDEIVEMKNSKKEEFILLKEKMEKVKEKELILQKEIEEERVQYSNVQNEVKNVQREIDLYESGKCPTCSTDFNSDHFMELKSQLLDRREKSKAILAEIENNINGIRAKSTKLSTIKEGVSSAFNDLNYLLKSYVSKIEELTRKQSSSGAKKSVNVEEFQNTVKELQNKKKTSEATLTTCKEKSLYYSELNRIFSEDGAKKSIIAGIIKPINHFIGENMKKIGLGFEVKLDETFTAHIKNMGNTIEHDTLSTGEQKLTNISILIAYLKLIRAKKQINILFLDEVFSSIDLDNIQKILDLLKSFANEYNINIFVVHHAVLNQEMFDRIINVNKDVFSYIEEVNYENM
jgi:DNA repair exonuclease SbcCD ATPase subunit